MKILKNLILFCMLNGLLFANSSSIATYLDDFQVNENVGRCNHEEPEIATSSNGNTIVVWEDNRDEFYSHIYAQIYDANGVAVGNNFKVDDTNGNPQTHPDVCADSSGNFIVIWFGSNDEQGIYIQRYDAEGNFVGENVLVETGVNSERQSSPAISSNANGNFTVVWQDQRHTYTDIIG